MPSMSAGNRASMSLSIPMNFYSSTSLSSSTSNLNSDPNSTTPLSPRTLYAQTFDRPSSSRSLPSGRFARKNMKEMTGFGTTEEEFEALPIAVRRKVRRYIFLGWRRRSQEGYQEGGDSKKATAAECSDGWISRMESPITRCHSVVQVNSLETTPSSRQHLQRSASSYCDETAILVPDDRAVNCLPRQSGKLEFPTFPVGPSFPKLSTISVVSCLFLFKSIVRCSSRRPKNGRCGPHHLP